ncbi:MAG TPA: hypothetical protein VID27_05890 [Blastocatellia bacterium]|jgi:hypothetical protein
MQTQSDIQKKSGDFLFNKSVFLLTSSVGRVMAETLVSNALQKIGSTPQSLIQSDISRLATTLEPALCEFVGSDKAKKLASALRVLVGGISGL